MAEDEHGQRARRLRGERDVRPTDGVLLSHDRAVRRSVQPGGPVLGVRQVGRIAAPGRVDVLVGHQRVGGRNAVHRAPAHLPRCASSVSGTNVYDDVCSRKIVPGNLNTDKSYRRQCDYIETETSRCISE